MLQSEPLDRIRVDWGGGGRDFQGISVRGESTNFATFVKLVSRSHAPRKASAPGAPINSPFRRKAILLKTKKPTANLRSVIHTIYPRVNHEAMHRFYSRIR